MTFPNTPKRPIQKAAEGPDVLGGVESPAAGLVEQGIQTKPAGSDTGGGEAKDIPAACCVCGFFRNLSGKTRKNPNYGADCGLQGKKSPEGDFWGL
jgi:hypothetical protein